MLPITDENGRPCAPISDGAVVVEDDYIVAVGSAADIQESFGSDTPVRTWPGVLMPGLINAHTHLQYTAYGDMAETGLAFPEWIAEMIRRREHTTDDEWATSAATGAALLIATGPTSVADVVTDQPAIAPVALSGLGGVSFLEMLGYDDARWSVSGRIDLEQRFDEAHPDRNVGSMSHAIYTLDLGAFADVLAYGRERGARTHVHLAESEAETEYVATGDGSLADSARAAGWDFALVRDGGAGVSPTQLAYDLGCLSPEVHVAHGVHCSAEDRALLRRQGTVVALCPRSNAILGSGTPPIADYLREGSPIALGTDSLASSPSLDLLDEVRAATVLARAQGYDDADLVDRMLRAATYGGARALGRHVPRAAGHDSPAERPIGGLYAGAQADLAMFVVDDEGQAPGQALLDSGRCVATVMRGVLVFEVGD